MTPSAPTEREAQPLPKIGPWRDKLDQLVLANEGKASRERLTLIRLFEELRTWVGQRRVDRVDKRPELRRLCFDIDPHGELAERSAAHRGDGRDEPVKACWSDASSPLAKEGGVRADQKPRPMSAHLAGGGAARRPEPLRPFHHARRADAQRPRDHPHALACLNPRQSAFAQIHRIGSCHPPRASDSIQFLNQKPGNLGIPPIQLNFIPL
jgi:hypothetical protein